MSKRPKKLLDQVRDTIRLKHYSISTEKTYVAWIKRYILFHNKRHPKDMGVPEIEAFLTHLAVKQRVAASTQNQALNALLFLYREVLKKDLERPIDALRAKRPKRVPTVLTKEEVRRVIGYLSGTHQLMAKLLYGSVYLPYALERKYPNASREWIWQYVFPSNRLSQDPRSGVVRRHHLHESSLQKAVRKAAKLAGINMFLLK